jgi:hypothetical protein
MASCMRDRMIRYFPPVYAAPASRAAWAGRGAAATARAGNRARVSTPRVHTKAPYKPDLHRETLGARNKEGGPGPRGAACAGCRRCCAAPSGAPRGGTTCLAAGEPVIKYKTRTDHSESLILRGTVCDVDHLDQPWAGLSLIAHLL